MSLTIVKKEISLNVGQPNNFELVCAMQGDNKSFEITATLYDVNKLYTISTNSIKLKGENPAGLTIHKNVDSHTTNTVTFTLTEDMLMYDGILKLVLVFTENGAQLTTFPFVIKVINSPGNNTADDIKTVSGLVEEAKKWAMLSKSYAVGTGNEVREGDAKDNSKYYYEQIKGLLDSGKIGNGKILYFETYGEFKKELDAGNIKNETLICIRENAAIDGGDSGNDNDKFDFTGKTLIYYSGSGHPFYGYSNNLFTWKNYNIYKTLGGLPVYAIMAYGNNMIFLITMQYDYWELFYTVHDFYTTSDDIDAFGNVWYKDVNFSSKITSQPIFMEYVNEHLVIVCADGSVYSVNKESIDSERTKKSGANFANFSFTKQSANISNITAMAYDNNIFVAIYHNDNSYKTAYSTDCKNWKNINGTISLSIFSVESLKKLIYGNGIFFFINDFDSTPTRKHIVSILDSNNISNGWKYALEDVSIREKIGHSSERVCKDVIYDNKNKRFIVYFTNDNDYSGFYIFNGTDWEVIKHPEVIGLSSMYVYDGILFGTSLFIESGVPTTYWIEFDNNLINYVKHEAMKDDSNMDVSFPEAHQLPYDYQYILLDSPLWDIDNDAAT